MNKRKTMTYAVAAGVATTLALAGCNGGDEDPTATPTPTSSTSSSATPSGSATPTASASASVDIPAEARANTDAGAMAFVRFYFNEVNSAYRAPAEGTADRITQISTNDCKSCIAGANDVRSLGKAGQRLASPAFAPLTGVSAQKVTDTQFRVTFTMTQTDAQVLDANGAVVDNQVAKSQGQIASVVWRDGSWRMDGLAAA